MRDMDAYEESMVAVGVDGSKESRATVRWAAAEAFWREAELCLVYAYTYPVSIAWHRLPLVARPECCDQAAEEMLAHIERDELGGYPSLAVRRIAVPGLAADVLMEVGRTADLLVVGATARHPLGHTLLGSVARALTRHPPCPVVVVPRPTAASLGRPELRAPAPVPAEQATGPDPPHRAAS